MSLATCFDRSLQPSIERALGRIGTAAPGPALFAPGARQTATRPAPRALQRPVSTLQLVRGQLVGALERLADQRAAIAHEAIWGEAALTFGPRSDAAETRALETLAADLRAIAYRAAQGRGDVALSRIHAVAQAALEAYAPLRQRYDALAAGPEREALLAAMLACLEEGLVYLQGFVPAC